MKFWNIIKWLPAVLVVIGAFFMLKSCYNDVLDNRSKIAKQEYEDSIKDENLKRNPIDGIGIDQEKIILYSLKEDLNQDTCIVIVKEYINIKLNSFKNEYNPYDFNPDSCITALSSKYKVPKKDIAALIFNYKYPTEP